MGAVLVPRPSLHSLRAPPCGSLRGKRILARISVDSRQYAAGKELLVATGEIADGRTRFDLVIIGDGAGSFTAARLVAAAGGDVLLVVPDGSIGNDDDEICLALFSEAARIRRRVQHASEFGVHTKLVGLELEALAASYLRASATQVRWRDAQRAALGISMVTGIVAACTATTAVVRRADGGELTVESKAFVLAPRTRRVPLPGLEFDRDRVLQVRDLLNLRRLPPVLTLIGSDAIGCSLSWALAELGIEVTFLVPGAEVIPDADTDVQHVVRRSLADANVVVMSGAAVVAGKRGNGMIVLEMENGKHLDVNGQVLVAGRCAPAWDGLFVDPLDRPLVDAELTDAGEQLEGAFEGWRAIVGAHTAECRSPVAAAEAARLVRNVLGGEAWPTGDRLLPTMVPIEPEIAYAGMSENAAHAAGREVLVQRIPFAGNGRARIIGATDGFVKLITERALDGGAGSLLGVHMAGPMVGEQLGQALLAIQWGATPGELADLVQPHPSLSEAFGEALLALAGRGLHAT